MQELQDRPSTIGAYAFGLAKALEHHDVDPSEVFAESGLQLPTVTDPLRRLSNSEVSRLFLSAVKHSGDPAIGLLVGESLHPGNLHALGYALLSSTSLRDFCDRLVAYYRIVSQNAVIHIEEDATSLILVTKAPAPDLCWETHDAFAALMVKLVRFIYSPDFSPRKIELMRPEPKGYQQRYDEYFRCPLSYDASEVRFHLDVGIVDQHLPGASKELALMHDQTVRQYLQQLEKSDIANRVRTIVVEELSSHALTKQLVAEKLFMSPRSLQLKLAAMDTSFQEILDTTRRALAISYMEQASVSITEAAYLIGFSEVSNFTRAFRRWTGQSPREYRRELGIE